MTSCRCGVRRLSLRRVRFVPVGVGCSDTGRLGQAPIKRTAERAGFLGLFGDGDNQ